MVRWFSPILLLHTLGLVLIARVFGAYADRREREAILPANGSYTYEGDELWLDYVADLGDGWDSTTSIAALIAEPSLALEGEELPHGRVLVMGGDQAYPAASREAYLHRLESPYYSVLPWSPEASPRDLFALPGNHDWYDGLTAFARLFLQGRWFAGWRTRQSRSYFALRLPQRWWFIGVDVQLGNDIDLAQRDYLLAATADMAPGDRVIFAAAQPWWFEAPDSVLRRDIDFLERRLVTERGASVRIALAGDLHHYQRHEREDGAQRVTAGGGGAFLHGTAWSPATLRESRESAAWVRRKAFPDALRSRMALWRLLLFPLFNPGFALLLGGLLAVLLWVIDAASNGVFFHNATQGAGAALRVYDLFSTLPISPAATFAVGLWVSGFVAFARAGAAPAGHARQALRTLSGLAHAMLHLIPAVWLLGTLSPDAFSGPDNFFSTLLFMAAVLSLTSGLLFGVWVFFACQLFGMHRDTAYSACRIADWKHFLRLHVRADGDLDIHVIGVPRVCRRWRWQTPVAPGAPHVVPADGVPLAKRARLVEKVRVPAGR